MGPRLTFQVEDDDILALIHLGEKHGFRACWRLRCDLERNRDEE